MNVIVFPGVSESNDLRNQKVIKKETNNVSVTKLLSQAFKALKEHEKK